MRTLKPGGKPLMISVWLHANVSRKESKLTNQFLNGEKKRKTDTLVVNKQRYKL